VKRSKGPNSSVRIWPAACYAKDPLTCPPGRQKFKVLAGQVVQKEPGQVAKLISSRRSLDDARRLKHLNLGFCEICSKQEVRETLLSPGLIDDVRNDVRLVQANLIKA